MQGKKKGADFILTLQTRKFKNKRTAEHLEKLANAIGEKRWNTGEQKKKKRSFPCLLPVSCLTAMHRTQQNAPPYNTIMWKGSYSSGCNLHWKIHDWNPISACIRFT